MNLLAATLICTGIAPTTPVTNVEFEIKRSEKPSTIRYEIAEGSLSGTAYIQSIGYMKRTQVGSTITYFSGNSPNSTKLVLKLMGNHIHESRISHHISGMKDAFVDCYFEEDSGAHSEGH